jgi:hypothetical protein
MNDRDIKILNDLLAFCRESIRDYGGCDHAVNVCFCDAARTVESAANLFHRISNGKAGNPPLREPSEEDPAVPMIDLPKSPKRPHEAFRFINETFAQCDVPSFMSGLPLEMD